MKNSLLPFALAPIAVCFLLQSPLLQAMTLGELQIKSHLGQRFKADIPYRLNADERLIEDCNQLRPSDSESTYLGPATVQIIPNADGSSGVIRVLSQKSAEEPIIGFALRVECENLNLTRDFVVFLDPPPLINAPTVAEPNFKLASPAAAKGAANSKTHLLGKASSLAQIARRYYSPSSPQYDLYLQKLQRSNPSFLAEEIIAAGTEVQIPPRQKSKSSSNLPASRIGNLGGANSTGLGQLRLEGDERSSVPPENKATNQAAYIRDLEAKVAELTELRKKLQFEIDALDARLAQNTAGLQNMQASAVTVSAAPPAVNIASASQELTKVKEVNAVHPPKTEAGQARNAAWSWQWPSLALLGLFGSGVWWWIRRKAVDDDFSAVDSRPLLSVARPRNMPANAGETQFSLLQSAHSAIEVTDGEGSSLEQAQFFLAHGDTFRAIELLQQLVEADPQDVERWLMLFRVYRQQGMKSDYIQLAHRFRAQTPPPAEDDWELVRSIGQKLAPEHELFIREERVVVQNEKPADETPVDLAIENLTHSSPAGESEHANDEINLIQIFQPTKTTAKPIAVTSDAMAFEDSGIVVPELSTMNHQADISAVEQLEFAVKDIEFDDEQPHKKTS